MASATTDKKGSSKEAGKDTGKEHANKVKITDAGPCAKKIHIEIPAEAVAEQLGLSVDTLLSEAAVPGFRRGRAPRRLVERKFGSTIRKEAKNQLVGQAFSKAVEDHKLRVIGDAASDMLDKIEVAEGKSLTFEVEVEVVPEFDLPDLEGLDIRRPTFKVTDEMVTQEIDRLMLNEGKLEPKETPEPGDYLTGHAVMKDAHDKTILDIHDAVVQIPTDDKDGKGMILGVVVDDFSKQFGTPKPGDTATIHTTGPESHEDDRIRGHKLVITFGVKRCDQIIPASLEDVSRRYGMETAEQVKEAIRERIDQRLQVEQQSAMRSQIATHLLNTTEFELPQRLTAAQASRNLERTRLELLYRGVDQQKIEEKIAELRASTAAGAARELKAHFVLDRAAEKLDVKVTDAELNGRIAQIALSRGERPEKFRQELIARNQLGGIYQQVREHKTLDAILAKSKVKDMVVEEYNKLAAELNEGAKAKAVAKAGKHEKHDKGEDKGEDDQHKSKKK